MIFVVIIYIVIGMHSCGKGRGRGVVYITAGY